MLARMMATARSTEFADFLRQIQETHNLGNIAELSRFLGIQQSSVSRWLDGSSEPSLANLRKIADRLDAPVGEVIVDAGVLTSREMGKVAAKPRRLAPVLRDVQDFLDDPRSTDKEKQFLLKSVRGLLNMIMERRG
jgi:transcriptional regulator with XRE-family HTH domain